MDYYLGDEREIFEEVFSEEIKAMAKPVLWVLYFLLVFIVSSWFVVNIHSETFLGLFLKEYGLRGFTIILILLFYFIFRKSFKEEKLFEDWKAGKYPDRPNDYSDHRLNKQ
ncbi:MAG: hypothetical protein Q8R34_00235 [bacterium]|nr:hypothetical protein [bacterium]